MCTVKYAIGEFLDGSKSFAIIPLGWLIKGPVLACFWPPFQDPEKINKLVRKRCDPESSWNKFNFKVIGKATTYKRATAKLINAKGTSNIGTEGEELQPQRKKTKTAQNQISTSEDESHGQVLAPVAPTTTAKRSAPCKKSTGIPCPQVPDGLRTPTSSRKTQPDPPNPEATYKRARDKLINAEETSNIGTEGEELQRKKTKTARYQNSTSEDESHGQGLAPVAPTTTAKRSAPCKKTTGIPCPQVSDGLRTPTSSRKTQPDPPIPEAGYQKLEMLMREMISSLEMIKETQLIHGNNIRTLIEKTSESSDNLCTEELELPTDVTLPLETTDQLNEFNDQLKDKQCRKKLIKHLKDLGGRSIQEMFRRVMGSLISDSLCGRLNMTGRNGKKSLKKSPLLGVVFRAIQQNKSTCEVTQQDVERLVPKWLIGGRDRGGNRQKRAKRETAKRTGDVDKEDDREDNHGTEESDE